MTIQEFMDNYLGFHRPYIAHANKILSKYHLFAAQWAVLKTIYRHGDSTLTHLSAVHHVEMPTMRSTVKKLIDLKYLKASPGTDKREKKLSITDEGHHIASQIAQEITDLQKEIFKGIDENNLQIASKLLAKMKLNLLTEK